MKFLKIVAEVICNFFKLPNIAISHFLNKEKIPEICETAVL